MVRVDGLGIDQVDVVRVRDGARLAIVQREIEVLRVDQRAEPLVNRLQEFGALADRAGEVRDVV